MGTRSKIKLYRRSENFGCGVSRSIQRRPRSTGGTPESNLKVYQVEPKFLHAYRRRRQGSNA